MKFCDVCGGKLNQRGQCPACIKKENQRQIKPLLIIGGILLVAILAVLVTVLCLSIAHKEAAERKAAKVFDPEDYDHVGTCGAHLQWGYDESQKELVIAGDGAMDDPTYTEVLLKSSWGDDTLDVLTPTPIKDPAPWEEFREGIEKVVISDGVTYIADGAFTEYIFLTEVEIGDDVTEIGDGAFSSCPIPSVELGRKVETIGTNAFYGCGYMTSVTIPKSVTTIKYWAFQSCVSLKDVYYTGTQEQWNQIQIEDGNDHLLEANIHFSQ